MIRDWAAYRQECYRHLAETIAKWRAERIAIEKKDLMIEGAGI